MRRLVGTLIVSIPEIINAGFFVMFMTILFSILGLQQFVGILHYRCRLTEKPLNATYWPISPDHPRVCSATGRGGYMCPAGLTCGSPGQYGISLEDDGVYNDVRVNYGIASYDNFGEALLAVFYTLTAENWTTMMYNVSVN